MAHRVVGMDYQDILGCQELCQQGGNIVIFIVASKNSCIRLGGAHKIPGYR